MLFGRQRYVYSCSKAPFVGGSWQWSQGKEYAGPPSNAKPCPGEVNTPFSIIRITESRFDRKKFREGSVAVTVSPQEEGL